MRHAPRSSPAEAISSRWGRRSRWRGLLLLVLLAACGEADPLGEPFQAATPREAYAQALREAGLAGTALARDWIAAGERALADPVGVALPFRESGYFGAEEPFALGYRIRGTRGQRLTVRVEVHGSEPMRMFVDLFSIAPDTARAPEHLASADSGSATLAWEPRRDGEYLLRLQPELLRSGRYTLTIRSEPALAFPVEGRDSRAIQSFFGADRDGGRRRHHGVDIFAPRGTPVVAVADGFVLRVGETPRGGRVVWLRDAERGLRLYYAHLDTQLVASGTRVRAGDTLGLVGNTGNARSTPPHLHFGIYRRGEGPTDPLPWVRETRTEPAPLLADTGRLGEWARVAEDGLRLRAEPTAEAAAIGELPLHLALRISGASGEWYRVVLPDGSRGYVAARLTEPARAPLRRERLARGGAIRDRPSPRAPVIDSVAAEVPVAVLGRFAGFLLVEAPGGREGWLRTD